MPYILLVLPLVSREWKNGSNGNYSCTPFLHSLLTKGKLCLTQAFVGRRIDACNSSTVSPTIFFFSGPCLVILHICVCVLCRPQLWLVHVDTVNSVCWWIFCFLGQRGPGNAPMALMPSSLDKNRWDRSLLPHVCIVSSEQDSLHGHTRISLACFAVRTCSLHQRCL